jgi:hypothetical protein
MFGGIMVDGISGLVVNPSMKPAAATPVPATNSRLDILCLDIETVIDPSNEFKRFR